jgi:hypothetical protein
VEATGKLDPVWEGPFRIVRCHRNGKYKLEIMEDKEVMRT